MAQFTKEQKEAIIETLKAAISALEMRLFAYKKDLAEIERQEVVSREERNAQLANERKKK